MAAEKSASTTCISNTRLYDILGVSSNATSAELKKAFRKKALQFFPDKHRELEDEFKVIKFAYDILYDEDKRAVYDTLGEDGLQDMVKAEPEGLDEDIFKLVSDGGFFDNIGHAGFGVSADGARQCSK